MSAAGRRLKIGIEFRVEEPRQGVGTAVIALLHGLGALRQEEQEYVLIVWDRHAEFFRPYVTGNCTLVAVVPAGFAIDETARQFVELYRRTAG